MFFIPILVVVEMKTLSGIRLSCLVRITLMTLFIYLLTRRGPTPLQERGVEPQVLKIKSSGKFYVMVFLCKGTTEGLAMIESIMEHIAYSINMDPLEVRLNNIDKVKQEKLIEFINQIRKCADIDQRKKEIADHNKVS